MVFYGMFSQKSRENIRRLRLIMLNLLLISQLNAGEYVRGAVGGSGTGVEGCVESILSDYLGGGKVIGWGMGAI